MKQRITFPEFMQTPKLFNESQENNLEKLYSFCEQYKVIVLNYESDNFGAAGCFLADITLFNLCF